ncbi:MAG: hypothetical protein LBN24_01665 [Mediterranea sp.]|nr:hypothetical protein [Mediterranea sp.]
MKVSQKYGNEAQISRTAEEPTVVYKDMGDGIIMRAEIKADQSPSARINAIAPLAEGSKVRVVIYRGADKTICSVQDLDVSDGQISISVPTAFKYGILFITNDKIGNTPTYKDALGGAPAIGQKLSDINWEYRDHGTDLLFTNTGMIDKAPTGIILHHLFSKINLTVNGASLSPTSVVDYFNATMAAPTEATINLADWDHFSAGQTVDDAVNFAASGGQEGSLTPSHASYFIPSGKEEKHRIVFSGLKLIGDNKDYAHQGKELAFEFEKAFQANTSYSVTINLTKKLRAKTVLGVTTDGLDDTFGYAGRTGGSKEFLGSPNNFSPKGVVPVDMQGITIETLPKGRHYSNDVSDNEDLRAALTRETPPDIVIFAVYAYWHRWDKNKPEKNRTSKAILDYVNKGGVVLIFCEKDKAYNDGYIQLVDDELNSIDHNGGGAGTVYLMDERLVSDSNDPILSGKIGGVQRFGSVAGKYWGEDASISCTFDIKDEYKSDFVQYSVFNKKINGRYYPTMIRYKKKNVIMVGDAGFISCPSSIENSKLICPFRLDSKSAPTSKLYEGCYFDTAGNTKKTNVDNSSIFANMMAWAIYQAESGINKDKNE